MTKPIKSRHGLTRCCACRAHIRAAATPSATVCSFCGANLHAGPAEAHTPRGRGGILAASLLAFSAVGCGAQQAGDDPADTTVSADDGAGGDQYDPEPADDNAAVAEYGVSPDAFEDDAADDPRPTPRYGLPPSRR